MVGKYETVSAQESRMPGKLRHLDKPPVRLTSAVMSLALLCIAMSTPAISQVSGSATGQGLTRPDEGYDRFESERLRQQHLQLEVERRKQEKLRFEIERLRQENERRKRDQLRLENEQLRQESERREQEELRLENEQLRQESERHKQEELRLQVEVRNRVRVKAAALRQQQEEIGQSHSPNILEQLRTIGQLRDSGILTEVEFQNLKERILD